MPFIIFAIPGIIVFIVGIMRGIRYFKKAEEM